MKTMRRFSDGGGGKLERLVVSSVRDERPSPHLRRQVERAVGLGVGVTAVSATARAGAKALGGVKTLRAGVSLAIRKWVAIAAVTGVTAGTGAYVHSVTQAHLDERAQPHPTTATAPVLPRDPFPSPPPVAAGDTTRQGAPRTAAPALVAPRATTAIEAAPTPRSGAAPAPVPRGTSSAPGAASGAHPIPVRSAPAPNLGDELRVLDEAHAALRAGEVAQSLALLDQHDRDFPSPSLAPEVLALRVEASVQRGDPTTEDLATRFLALYGDRPEAQHIRSILSACRSTGLGASEQSAPPAR